MVSMRWFMLVYLLLAVTWGFRFAHETKAMPVQRPLAEFPVTCASWRMESQNSFSRDVLEILRPSDYFSRQYAGPGGEKVSVYLGYHDGGKGSGEIHTPRNCLPGNGWQLESSGRMDVATASGQVRLVKAVYRKNGLRELFLYWFQARDKTITDEYSLKLNQILNSVTSNRRETAFVRISVPIGDSEAAALAAGTGFIRDFYPQTRGFLPM